MIRFIKIIATSLVLSGCATLSNSTDTPASKQGLLNLTPKTVGTDSINVLRLQALRDTALSVGARGGLAWRSQIINHELARYDKSLARIFNFQLLMLDNNILPPVLIESRNNLSLNGVDTIHISDRIYGIAKQACFTTVAPNWRDYLWASYGDPEAPDSTLLPKNSAEKIVWQRYIDEGWQAGVVQANLIFRENLARLKRDFEGMLRYRRLLSQNMVSAPYVATLEMGITGGGEDLAVNDRVLRITAFPKLKSDGNKWKTEIVLHD